MAGIEEFLSERNAQGLLRTLRPATLRKDGRICIGEREYIDFSSNDYLGLSGHPKLIEAAKKALDEFGTSSSASRLLSGDLALHHQLETEVAEFKHKERALVFNSGYQANLGIISALYKRGDGIFSDRLNHASIIDGIILSGARFFRFQHNDTDHLELLLKKERSKFAKALIVTETIFSMEGDRAPLKDLVELKEKYRCEIFVDEAHATGVFGKMGSGVVEEEALEDEIDFIMGTFGKALGGFGAYFASSNEVIDYLINTARSFIYSTALPPAVIASNLAGIELVKEEPSRRKELLNSAEYFRRELKRQGFKVRGSSQIIPLIMGESLKAVKFAHQLQEKGYWVLPIRPPTVVPQEARVRFSLTFYHSREILQKLIDDISKLNF